MAFLTLAHSGTGKPVKGNLKLYQTVVCSVFKMKYVILAIRAVSKNEPCIIYYNLLSGDSKYHINFDLPPVVIWAQRLFS